MTELNGNHKYDQRFDKIDKEMYEIKDELSSSIKDLTRAVDGLATHFSTFINVAQSAIPIKAVFWMFFILVLTIAGIEGVKLIPKWAGLL